MATRNPRITLTIKLTVGKDDELIAWLASLPKGERQGKVKCLLREAVQHPDRKKSQLDQIGEDTTWLRAALTDLPGWMEQFFGRMAVMSPSHIMPQGSSPMQLDQLSGERVTRREKRIAKATW